MRAVLSALVLAAACLGAHAQILINEIDANQSGVDTAEFVELYDGGIGNSSLDDLTLVFYNGTSNSVYAAYDLSGLSTNTFGYFVAGNAGVSPPPGLVFPNDFLRNGVDAVALYIAPIENFPFGQFVTTDNLVDALVYETGQAQSVVLATLLNPGQAQVDEDADGTSNFVSMQRCPDGSGGTRNTHTFALSSPTPGARNDCASLLNVIINEVDSDQAGLDTAEFVELYDGGTGFTPLDHFVLVLYNGGDDAVYAAYDLDGKTTDVNGYFLLGSAGMSPDLTLNAEGIQDGADAVALYIGDAAEFPIGAPVSVESLVDALVYDTGNADDAGLLPLLNEAQPQVNENDESTKDIESMQRCPNGSGARRDTSGYYLAAPTPRAANTCPPSAPGADFTWTPSIVYAGQPINFHDRSTGQPTSWQWTFNGSDNGVAFSANPTGIVFNTDAIGGQIVQLYVSNTSGNDTAFQVINVLDPVPSASGIIVSPQGPVACQPATFIAYGVYGRPPLTFAWDLLNTNNESVFSGNGNPLTFVVPGVTPAASYRARVTISNDAGDTDVLSTFFNSAAPAGPALTLAAAGHTHTNLNQIPVNLHASVDVSGLEENDFTLTNATLSNLSGIGDTYAFTLVPQAEGDVTVQIKGAAVTDTCGQPNAASNVLTFVYDVTPPTASITPVVAGTNDSEPVQFTLAATEDLDPPNTASFSATNGTVASVAGSGASYTIDVAPGAPGIVALTATQGKLSDLAGNPVQSTLSSSVDFQPLSLNFHTTDQNQDNVISLAELLRLIQFYNSGGFHCEDGTEDGYAPLAGDTTCPAHEADYNPQDWNISLAELLRLIQFYNSLGYHRCDEGTEDGFCPGPPTG